jgi:DNA-binding MurR/RpiR family transcriptional regulator
MQNKNYEKALVALLETSTVAEAAKHAGLSEATIYRLLSDDDFQTEYRKTRRALVEKAVGQIQTATSKAVEALTKNLTCGTPSAEIRAAQIVMEMAHKGIEMTDILERLDAIEAIQKKQGGKK